MDKLTRQALPPDNYLLLLGASMCVFNANYAFVVENILRTSLCTKSWYELIDLESGWLKPHIAETISKEAGSTDIADLFEEVVDMRNRIVHSFQTTVENGDQMLSTKVRRTHEQFRITEDYLREFIEKNERLSGLLHSFRGH
ncbi:hypothetical protein B5F40_08805 [Gordonibacter sp. An230]|uniref:hypothetical protein n=1 Tax=Gordonibacter sp. An230 TaxID=1965592 RepID=UPI000B36DB0B|nr:hypothetical protein [Gordonibacter sp. An230]OUO89924.1 hypothetical protein B5F40_08805 [Gordonibacter sp. An230]